jgi:hypothetical protein
MLFRRKVIEWVGVGVAARLAGWGIAASLTLLAMTVVAVAVVPAAAMAGG